MNSHDEELEDLRAFADEVILSTQGNTPMVLMRSVRSPANQNSQPMDMLLHPGKWGGYETRLFMERKPSGSAAQNWKQESVCGRSWWVCSFNKVAANLPWKAIFLAHLREAFRGVA